MIWWKLILLLFYSFWRGGKMWICLHCIRHSIQFIQCGITCVRVTCTCSLLWPMTKAVKPIENFKKKSNNTKTPLQTAITHLLWTDLERSVGVSTVIQRAWLIRWTGTQPSRSPQELYNLKYAIFNKNVNDTRYREWGTTANQSEEVINIQCTNIFGNRNFPSGSERRSKDWMSFD